MTDIPKLRLVDNARKAFRFTFDTTATPAPAVPVDEASVNILETMQKRAMDKAHERALAEAQKRALSEAQKIPEAETQKPLPLSAEEQAQEWRAVFIAEKAQKLDREDRQKLQELALQQRIKLEQAAEDARKLAEDKALIDQLHEREFVARHAPVAHVTHVAPVVQVKPVRIRRYVPGYL
jgi:hypothetical protein